MNHSPIDIEQQEFSLAWRGVNAREVREFLHSIAKQMADLAHKNADLRSELGAQGRLIEQMQSRENQVKEALVMAQRTVEDIRTQADREAAIKIEHAEVQAQRIVSDAQSRHNHLTQQLGELTRQRVRLMEELRGLLATHGRLLDVHAAEVSRQVPEVEMARRGVLDMVEAPQPPGAQAARKYTKHAAGPEQPRTVTKRPRESAQP